MNKKRKIMQILAVATAGLSLFCAACAPHSSGSASEKPSSEKQWTFDGTLTEEYNPADTDIVLAENGETDYVIVVPQSNPWQVNTARTELQSFFSEATGATLPVTSDTGLTFDTSKKYISLGNTTVYQGSNLNLTVEEYDEDGFCIKRFGNTIIVAGAENNGTLYGIYDFLYYNLGVKVWSNEEITVPQQNKVYVKDFNYKSVPDISNRALGIWYKRYPEILEYRLKLNHNSGKNWIAWCHTSFELLPPDTYQKEHPDWYYPYYANAEKKPQQLCFTNEGMKAELIEVMKEKVTSWSSKYGLLQIGQEDNTAFCDCDSCKAEIEKYGYGGLFMRFMNEIADIMNPWVEETFKGEKQVKWVMFAYGKTTDAPVTKNSDGTYTPVDASVVAHENVGVMIAPLGSDWSHSLVDPEHNEQTKASVEGWSALNPEFYIYTYNVVFDNQMIFMDNWSWVKESYQLFQQINAQYIFDQGASHCSLPFYELTTYVRSRLLWDLNVDVEKEIDDFMAAYYKAAAPKVKEYFDLVRTRYKIIEAEMEAEGEKFWLPSYVRYDSNLLSEKYWPKEWCLNGIKIYDEALALCEEIEDPTEREAAIKRVKAERLSPIYLLMQLHRSSLNSADAKYYIELFREGCDVNSINYYTEHGEAQGDTVQKLLDSWSSGIN